MDHKDEKQRIKDRFNDTALHNTNGTDIKPEGNEDVTTKFLDEDEEVGSRRPKSRSSNPTLANQVKRLLIIFLIIGSVCLTVYLISRALASSRLKTYRLEGTAEEFEAFQGFPDTISPDTVTSFELRNVEVNGTDLLETLKDCSNLKTIRLENIKLLGDYPSEGGQIYLPNLEEFHYDEYSKNPGYYQNSEAMTEERLKSILFFTTYQTGQPRRPSKHAHHHQHNHDQGHNNKQHHDEKRNVADADAQVDLTKIWDIEPNVHISLGGFTVLGINHTTRELVLPWLNFLKREDIIRYAAKDLRRLTCNRQKLDISVLPPKLTHLTLRDVKLTSGDFTNLTTKLSKLVQLRVSFQEFTTLDLTAMPKKHLKELTLSRVAIHQAPLGTKKFNLTHLTLMSSSISPAVATAFKDIFLTKQLAFGEVKVDNGNLGDEEAAAEAESQAETLMTQMLEEEQLHKVYVYKFKGVTGAHPGVIEHFPASVSRPENVLNFKIHRNEEGLLEAHELTWAEWSHYKHRALGWDKLDANS